MALSGSHRHMSAIQLGENIHLLIKRLALIQFIHSGLIWDNPIVAPAIRFVPENVASCRIVHLMVVSDLL